MAEATAAKAATNGALVVAIPQIDLQTIQIRVVGDSPLVMHKWSEKAKQQMRDKQGKKARTAREAKDPAADYEAATHYTEDGKYGFPSVAFKAAAVSACRFVEGIKMTEARGAFHVLGEMVEIEGERRMREDMVRVGMGTADLRYRPEFPKWSATLTIRYNARALSAEQIINLFNTAGFGVGVGEFRPERDGSWGMFHVE